MNPRPPIPRWRRRLWFAALALAGFTLVGFFVLPPIAKAQLEKRASAFLGRTVTVGQVRMNPYALSLTIEDLDIRLKDGPGSFLGWNRLYLNFDALASLGGTWTLSEIELEGFHVAAILKPDGSLNFSDLIARLSPPGPAPAAAARPAAPLPPVRIGSLKVISARVELADQSRARPFATVLGPLTFSVTEFRSAPDAPGGSSHFEALSEAGEKFSWSGTINAFPLRSTGRVQLENIVLPKYTPYLVDRFEFDLVAGTLSLSGRYEINLAEAGRTLKFSDGALQVRGFRLAERPDDKDIAVEVADVEVKGIKADAMAFQATVDTVHLTGGHLRVRREADGSLNLLAMLQPPAGRAPAVPVPAAPAAPGKRPEFLIGEVMLKDFQVDLQDLAAPRPAELGLRGLQASLKKVTLADGAAMPFEFSFDWAPEGTVKAAGTVALRPQLKAELKTEVAGLAILPLSPYVEQFINARITAGTVTSNGVATVVLTDGQPASTFEGGVRVDKFGLVDAAHNEDLTGFASLALTDLKVATAPEMAVSIAEVKLVAPYTRVLVNADKSLNLTAVIKQGAAVPDFSKPVATAPFKIDIGRVVLSEGDFSLTDRSVEPNVQIAVNRFGGTLMGLSSASLSKADLDLKAAVDGSGPISIVGKIDLVGAQRFADLKVDFKNVDLLPLSPYFGQYAGYQLARGQLALDVKVQLTGTQIEVANLITLNQFTLGAKVKSPDATTLPVRLGVALLKDNAGKIVIDVPVSGDLSDPTFRVSRVVLRAIGNLLAKAATSPFSMIGAMFGGGGPELAYQEFTPGDKQLLATEAAKFTTVIKALENRPELNVGIEGSYDAAADTYGLKQQKVAAQVRRRIWEEQHAVNPNIPPPEELTVTSEANVAMLKKLFAEKFPPGTELGGPVAKAPAAAAPPPAPKKGWLNQMVDVLTLKSLHGGTGQPGKPVAVAVTDPATGPSVEEMTGRLAETMVVTENDLRALAAARAQRVRDYFLTEGKIAPERLFLANDPDPAKATQGARVFLELQ